MTSNRYALNYNHTVYYNVALNYTYIPIASLHWLVIRLILIVNC